MATYEIPRNTKGEGRLFYIFSTKALIFTVVGILVGCVIRWLLVGLGSLISSIVGKPLPTLSSVMSIIGIVFIAVLALLGFLTGSFKVPAIERFEITKKAAGINIDKVLWESIKFHFKRSKYYVYDTKELVREEIIKDEQEKKELEEKEEKARNDKLAQSSLNRRGYIQNGR